MKRTTNQPSATGGDQAAIPVVTAVTNTPATQVRARSVSATTAIPFHSTSAPVSNSRVPIWTRCKTAATQGARSREIQLAANQAVVQLIEMINEVIKEMQEEEELERADLVGLVSETVEEFPKWA